ncbi:MAG: hypothetical protein KatS3mg017_0836 [Fimbriimonadales bacterium]|nr:MAG: hypothetical protein KatS3mg017_0836 [Fimbriimonadales bacterium]GIV10179.1 MAG: hypothetical protein KatS3mg019_2270 [Fimbriimonadales bacterium]
MMIISDKTKPIGERVRELRRAQGVPQMLAARRAQVSWQSWWLLERHNYIPRSAAARERIAAVLGVDAQELFGDDGGES